MNQIVGWGIALIVIGAVLGLFHFLGFLVGDTLSWIAVGIFVLGVVLALVGSVTPERRGVRA